MYLGKGYSDETPIVVEVVVAIKTVVVVVANIEQAPHHIALMLILHCCFSMARKSSVAAVFYNLNVRAIAKGHVASHLCITKTAETRYQK